MCYIKHEKAIPVNGCLQFIGYLIKITAKFARLGAVIFMFIFYFSERQQSRLKRFQSVSNQIGLCTYNIEAVTKNSKYCDYLEFFIL